MRRRELLVVLATGMVGARSVRAQQKAVPVIGFLGSTGPGPFAANVAGFRQGLAESGYVEGQNVALEYRWAEDQYERLPALAADLVDRKVDVIATASMPSALAAKQATSTIPVVFETGTDPVEAGLVASFPRPGGNLTGVCMLTAALMPKRLELISELVPQAGLFGLLVNPSTSTADRMMSEMEDAARAKGVRLELVKAATQSEIDAAFAELAKRMPLRLSSSPIRSSSADASSSWRLRHAVPFQRSIPCANSRLRVD